MTDARKYDYKARPHQYKAITSPKKIVALFGGVGCGKTDCGSLFALRKIKENDPGVLGLIAANTYTQLLDSTIRNFYRKLSDWNIPVDPEEPPSTARPFNINIHNGRGWVEILCRSWRRTNFFPGTELGWAWLDEVWLTKQEAWNLVQARLRDMRAGNIQALLTTTPDDPSSWLYRFFIENYDPVLMEVINATSYSNKKNLPPGYIESLQATYSPALFDRMVLAKWRTLVGQTIYYAFSRSLHVSEQAEFSPELPLRWSHDFNIGEGKPMSSILCQTRKGPGVDGRIREELHVFDEIVIETADTNDAAREFKSRDWPKKARAGIIVYGDAQGRARDTRSKTTDYLILAREGFPKQDVPPGNPPVRERHNLVNSLLLAANKDVRIKIHPRCKKLIKGLEVTKLKKGANYIEDDSIPEQHVTTALGYVICRLFSLVVPRSTGGPKYWK